MKNATAAPRAGVSHNSVVEKGPADEVVRGGPSHSDTFGMKGVTVRCSARTRGNQLAVSQKLGIVTAVRFPVVCAAGSAILRRETDWIIPVQGRGMLNGLKRQNSGIAPAEMLDTNRLGS